MDSFDFLAIRPYRYLSLSPTRQDSTLGQMTRRSIIEEIWGREARTLLDFADHRPTYLA